MVLFGRYTYRIIYILRYITKVYSTLYLQLSLPVFVCYELSSYELRYVRGPLVSLHSYLPPLHILSSLSHSPFFV